MSIESIVVNSEQFSNFDFFLQSNSVSNVCRLLHLLGDFVPRSHTEASPWTSLGDFCPPGPLGYSPPLLKISGAFNGQRSTETLIL